MAKKSNGQGHVLKSKFLSEMQNNGVQVSEMGKNTIFTMGGKSVAVKLNGGKRMADKVVHDVCGGLGAEIPANTKPNKLMGTALAAVVKAKAEKANA